MLQKVFEFCKSKCIAFKAVMVVDVNIHTANYNK